MRSNPFGIPELLGILERNVGYAAVETEEYHSEGIVRSNLLGMVGPATRRSMNRQVAGPTIALLFHSSQRHG